MRPEAPLAAYLAEAASWDQDRIGGYRRSRCTAWICAAIATALAAAALCTTLALLPLKSVTPFLIRVDEGSGIVDVIPALARVPSLPESVTRFLLSHYVTTCERFTLATAEQDYTECGAFHSAARNVEWIALWSRANADSPLNRYRDGTSVRAQIQSVSFFQRASGAGDLAQVRFMRAQRAGGRGAEIRTHWIASIQYAYGEPSADPEVRRWNPLGFRILSYQLEAESADTTAPPPGSGT